MARKQGAKKPYGLGRWVLALLAPVLFLLGLELLLALVGPFEPLRLLRVHRVDGVDYVSTNPAYLRRFFQKNEVPSPPVVWTTLQKKPGTRRVILLGESAAAGFPVTDYNLARLVEAVWRVRHPNQPVEVLNLAAVAINSHVLRLFAREAMVLQPDLVILYAGHNEVIGPYGPASRFGRPYRSLALIRTALFVRNTRVGQALAALVKQRRPNPAAPRQEAWTGLNEFKDMDMAQDDPRLMVMLDHARLNFTDIVGVAHRGGASGLVAIPAVNLTDWEPARGGVVGAAADMAYQSARSFESAGDWARAWPAYRQACDLDPKRIRADSGIRAVLRQVGEHGGPDVRVVDVDRWLHELNPGFTTDRAYFLEHVHLTFAGRVAVATRLADGMESLWGGGSLDESGNAAWWQSFPDVARAAAERTLFNAYDEHDMWSLVWKLLRLEVFQSASGLERRRRELADQVIALKNQAIREWNVDRVRSAYALAVQLNPDDPVVYSTAGRLMGILRQGAEAEKLLRAGLDRRPNDTEGWLNLAMLYRMRGQPAQSREALAALARFDPQAPGIATVEAALVR